MFLKLKISFQDPPPYAYNKYDFERFFDIFVICQSYYRVFFLLFDPIITVILIFFPLKNAEVCEF